MNSFISEPNAILFAFVENPAHGFDQFLGGILVWLLPIALPILGIALAVYYAISLPLRRQERARFFLDLVESALSQGQPIERHIISLAQSHDQSIGAHFHLLAAHLEQGQSLMGGLARVPRMLPPQVLAMLKVGETLGDYAKVLPACRNLLRDGISQNRAAINYQVVVAFVLNPIALVCIPFISVKILPVMNDIITSLKLQMPALGIFSVKVAPLVFFADLAMALALYFCTVVFLGGPRFISWLEGGLPFTVDPLFFRVPWRRKRLQRDFSAMLALLLDAGVPEERAVLLAAESTANRVVVRRAQKVAAQLRAGIKLTEAIHLLDDTGEFRWRLENAAHFSSNFLRALKGWHASLDARAFQLEQTAAQTITTILVLLNASTVALVAATIFQCMAQFNVSPYK